MQNMKRIFLEEFHIYIFLSIYFKRQHASTSYLNDEKNVSFYLAQKASKRFSFQRNKENLIPSSPDKNALQVCLRKFLITSGKCVCDAYL